MRPAPEEERLTALRSLKLSEPVLRLATGKNRCQLFTDYARPYKVYHGMTWGRDPVFVPMWEKYGATTAVWKTEKGLEFFAFSAEAPRSRRSLARTEQGLLATLFFNPLNMWYDDPSDYGSRHLQVLERAAGSVGFRYLSEANEVFRTYYPKGYDAFRRAFNKLLQQIDAGRVAEAE